jgi:hypothetical protein
MGRVDARAGRHGAPYASGAVRAPLTWLEAWSIARYDLRLTDDEWLEMTPRQLHALRLRQIEQLQHSELMTGIIASVTANFSMMKPEPPFSAESFMIHKLPESPEDAEELDEEMDGDKLLRILGGLPAGAAISVKGGKEP